MMKREEGYYWVYRFEEWEIAHWDGEDWYLFGDEQSFDDTYFDLIETKKIIKS